MNHIEYKLSSLPAGVSKHTISISELMYLYHQSDTEAFLILQEVFRPMVRGIYNEYLKPSTTVMVEEWYAEADRILHESLMRYRYDSQASLETFYRWNLHNGVRTLMRNLNRGHHLYVHEQLSADQQIGEQGFLRDFLADPKSDIPRQVYVKGTAQQVVSLLQTRLNGQEMKVLNMLAQGFKRTEIQALTGYSPKRIRSLLTKCRRLCEEFDIHPVQ